MHNLKFRARVDLHTRAKFKFRVDSRLPRRFRTLVACREIQRLIVTSLVVLILFLLCSTAKMSFITRIHLAGRVRSMFVKAMRNLCCFAPSPRKGKTRDVVILN